MWRLPEYQIDSTFVNISMAASYHRVTNGIHVLLSDHDHKFLTSTADMLKRNFYKVTMVDCASAALSILSQKEEKFDAVIANIHSPDLQGFKLLRQAVSMDLLVILLCDQEDADMAVRLIEHGAFVLLDKPICQDTVKNLWQHVMRERSQRAKETMEKTREAAVIINGGDKGKGVRVEENENESYRGKGKRSRQSLNDGRTQSLARIKRKTCTEWTVELHEKFMDAVHQLGDGRCYPKEILELMNVPGLTRMQVASHLQKCRNDNWRAPEERKAPPSSVSPASGSLSRTEQRRFGSMPRLTTGNSQHQNHSHQQRENTRSPEVQSSPSINGVLRGDSSQTLLDRQYLTIGAAYGSKLGASSPQSVVQQVGTYNVTSGQAPIVGSINYRSGGIRLGAQNSEVWLEGNGGGVVDGLGGGSFYSDKDDFSDDPSNTTTGEDSYATPPAPPRLHRRLQSDEFFNFNDVEYEYLIQDFSDNHARQGVGVQANHNNASSSEYDKGFNIVQKEAKGGQASEMMNIAKISP